MTKRLTILIDGGAGSGKTTMAGLIKKFLEEEGYSLLAVDIVNQGNGTVHVMQRGDYIVSIGEGM